MVDKAEPKPKPRQLPPGNLFEPMQEKKRKCNMCKGRGWVKQDKTEKRCTQCSGEGEL